MLNTNVPVVLSVIYSMQDGAHASLHRHFPAGASWDETVIAARDAVRAQDASADGGCVIAAELRSWDPATEIHSTGASAGLGKVFQPSEWRS